MLTTLNVKNFAIVSQLECHWAAGMSTITGETGAGKSIAIDALSLCLGERAESSMVRAKADKAEVCAEFDVSKLEKAQLFLSEHDLDNGNECIIRRVVTSSGRSRSYINGSPVPVTQLKQLAHHLVAIHGQHAHQLLTKADHQLALLDEYAQHKELISLVQNNYANWKQLRDEFQRLEREVEQQQAKKQLLEYQVEELDTYAFQPGEFEKIEQEHKCLSHAQTLIEETQQQLNLLSEEDGLNICQMLQQACINIGKLSNLDNRLQPVVDLLNEAQVQAEEASNELKIYQQQVDLNPEKLFELESRIGHAMELSRKHHINPEQLADLHFQLAQELKGISVSQSRLIELEAELDTALQGYWHACKQLNQSRVAAAKQLNPKICDCMQQLSMGEGLFEIDVTFNELAPPSSWGADKVSFLVSTNPGQPLQPLAKVASGGELSRISLAIQVIIANRVTTPTLIFDEVDVGISGPTAAIVGKLLRQLGQSTQVICVTHLPQVACAGHHQYFVEKLIKKTDKEAKCTHTQMSQLSDESRVEEIARLLGGDLITNASIENARSLIATHA